MTKILYIQFTAAANYPPLQASSRLLADAGHKVTVLGVEADGAARELVLDPHPLIRETNLARPASRLARALAYPRFLARARAEVLRRKPEVLYCSDLKSYPLGAWAARRGLCKTVLHEHDPPGSGSGRLHAWLMSQRTAFARRATLCIIPQDERAKSFERETGAERIAVVYNCPPLREIRPPKPTSSDAAFTLWYHGSIGPQQLPRSLIDMLALTPPEVRLEFAGYETLSTVGYVDSLLREAAARGLEGRLTYHGPIPERSRLLDLAARCDAGTALFERVFRDPMVGASNKPFDYLACGLPLLVNDTEEWRAFYAAEGVAEPCNPESPQDIARAVLALRNDPARRAEMAARGYELMQTRWNYEAQFAKAFDILGLAQRELATPIDAHVAN